MNFYTKLIFWKNELLTYLLTKVVYLPLAGMKCLKCLK